MFILRKKNLISRNFLKVNHLSLALLGGITFASYSHAIGQTVNPPKVEEIIAKVESRKLPKSSKAELLLTINKEGSKVDKTFKSTNLRLSENETYTLIEFLKPTTTKILVHGRKEGEDDRWIKTSSGQPKRIAANAEDQSFSQSHFDYSDLQFAKGNEFKHELICEPKCEVDLNGAPHYKIKSVPKAEGKKYAYAINYIRISDYVPMKIEYFSKDGKPQKELTMEEVKDIKGYPTPMKVHAKIPGTKEFSTLTIQNIELDSDSIKKQQFDKNLL